MVITGNEDLRIQKTIENIYEAFFSLITEMDYEKITVTELCSRAKINKKTFYRYYPTLDHLLSELQEDMSSEYSKRVSEYSLPKDLDKVNREFFLYSMEKGSFYDKITCSGSYSYIRQRMINKVMENTWGQAKELKGLDRNKRNILYAFIESASVEMYRQWVTDKKKIPIDEVIELTNTLLCSGVNGLIEKLKNTI